MVKLKFKALNIFGLVITTRKNIFKSKIILDTKDLLKIAELLKMVD